MAKKKHHPPKEGPKPRARAEAELPERLPDRRAMEGVMRGFLGELLGPIQETPLTKAQDLIYQAFEEPDPEKRAELAKQALVLSPDYADAYSLAGRELPIISVEA